MTTIDESPTENPESVSAELERIRLENAGNLRAPDVLDAATPPTSPLHPLFEWDNSIAGHEHRLEQARRLIRLQVKKVQTGDPRKIRTYVNITQDGQRSYRHVDEVVADDELRAQAYRRLLNDLHAYKRRLLTYTAYANQVGPVITAIDQALDHLNEGGQAA